jgi:hypothetical protein
MGFGEGLRAWRRLLAPGGYLVVTEFCWFCEDPPAELRALHHGGDEDVGDVDARRRAVTPAGYRLVGEFVLPAVGWWESFYAPLGEALERFRQRYADNPAALDVAARCQREIDLYLAHPATFGYVFFILQKDGG